MNARNLLIGIGIVAVVAGTVLGSGALTTVNAERTATVETAGDSSAAIGLSEASNSSSVVGSGSGDTLSLTLTDLNKNATTTVTAFNITNNVGEDVGIQVGSSESWLTATNVNTSGSYVTLAADDTITVTLEVDTTSGSGYSGSSDATTITVVADTEKP